MTGFSFVVYIFKYGSYNGSFCLDDCGMEVFKNNVYLSGKDMFLFIVKSIFFKIFKNYKEKIKKIFEYVLQIILRNYNISVQVLYIFFRIMRLLI